MKQFYEMRPNLWVYAGVEEVTSIDVSRETTEYIRYQCFYDDIIGRRACPDHGCNRLGCLHVKRQARTNCGCPRCTREYQKLDIRIHHLQNDPYYRDRMRGYSADMIYMDEAGYMSRWPQEYTATWGVDLGYDPASVAFKPKETKKLKSGDDMNLVEKVKNLKLSKADKLLRKHGVVDVDGNVTDVGLELLTVKLFETHKDEIVTDLEAIDKEAKASK